MEPNMSMHGSITGVLCEPLTVFSDERGAVLRMLRSDSPIFQAFGEIYFSEVNPGVVKGWKRHLRMTQHFAVPHGRIKIVIYDDRQDSPTCGKIMEVMLGRPDDYMLLVIPPMLWYGFQGITDTPSLLCNFADLIHDPYESEKLDIFEKKIPYHWTL
jgi:dTDP-4-dehydrorhamnose 3,5-epimerase